MQAKGRSMECTVLRYNKIIMPQDDVRCSLAGYVCLCVDDWKAASKYAAVGLHRYK